MLGDVGANIVEILHQRMFVDLSAKSAEVEVTVETLDQPPRRPGGQPPWRRPATPSGSAPSRYRDAPPDTTPRP